MADAYFPHVPNNALLVGNNKAHSCCVFEGEALQRSGATRVRLATPPSTLGSHLHPHSIHTSIHTRCTPPFTRHSHRHAHLYSHFHPHSIHTSLHTPRACPSPTDPDVDPDADPDALALHAPWHPPPATLTPTLTPTTSRSSPFAGAFRTLGTILLYYTTITPLLYYCSTFLRCAGRPVGRYYYATILYHYNFPYHYNISLCFSTILY